MDFLQEYQRLMTEYDQAVQELQKKRKVFDGLLGVGNHPGNAACHELLDRQTEALCREALEKGSPEELKTLAEAVFQSERKWQGPEYARLMLVAIQRHTLEMIPRMEKTDRENLAAWYRQAYPRMRRLPVQDQVLKALKG